MLRKRSLCRRDLILRQAQDEASFSFSAGGAEKVARPARRMRWGRSLTVGPSHPYLTLTLSCPWGGEDPE
ncbi:MAG: hypothetical protein P8Z74_11905 [Acidobacteriota bacterium]